MKKPILVVGMLLGACGWHGSASAQAPSTTPTPTPTPTPRAKGCSAEQKQKAIAAFGAGRKLFNGGYYKGAIAKYVQARGFCYNAMFDANIAQAYKWLDKILEAINAFEAALKRLPAKPVKRSRQLLKRRIEVELKGLLAQIGRVRVVIQGPAGAEVQVRGKVVGLAPLNTEIRMIPGEVRVTAVKKDWVTHRGAFVLKPGETRVVSIRLIKVKKRIVIKGTPSWKRWWFWVALVGSAGAAAVGLWAGLEYGTTVNKRPLEGKPIFHDGLVRW